MKDAGRTAILSIAGLAIFSAVFSLAAERGLWPGLAPGALHDTDLAAGFAGGALLLWALVRRAGERAAVEHPPERAGNAPARGDV